MLLHIDIWCIFSYTVPKKEVNEFSRNGGEKVESSVLAEAVHKALKYLDNNELPVHWERNSLFNMQSVDTDSEENYSDVSNVTFCLLLLLVIIFFNFVNFLVFRSVFR